MENIILIKDEKQAKEYLKKFNQLKNTSPITFSFSAEEILSRNNLIFKMEEDYESAPVYTGIHKKTKEILHKILSQFKLEYRGIELFSLFYSRLYFEIMNSLKLSFLMKEIVKKENPKKIYLFKDEQDDLFYEVAKNLFKGELILLNHEEEKPKKKRASKLPWILSKFQKIHVVISLISAPKNEKIILMSGGKNYFKSIATSLSDKKVINFGGSFTKSFFVGKKYLPFYEFQGKNEPDDEARFKTKMEFFFKEIEKINLEKKVYSGGDISPHLIKKILLNLAKSQFPLIIKKINEMFFLFRNKKIKVILLSEDDSEFSKAVARVARIFKIPTIAFLHGLPVFGSFGKSETDYFVVFGENTEKWFAKNKIKNKEDLKKVKVFGCPWFDHLKPDKNRERKIILYSMEIADKNHVMPENHLTKKEQKEILRWLFDLMKKLPDYHLILKTRPRWYLKELPSKIARERNFKNFSIIEKTDNLDLLNSSKIVIINMTTMGLEALLLNKPVISVNFRYKDSFNPYKKIKSVKKAYTREQLEKLILGSLQKEKSPSISEIKKEIILDRRATQRTLSLIDFLLAQRDSR